MTTKTKTKKPAAPKAAPKAAAKDAPVAQPNAQPNAKPTDPTTIKDGSTVVAEDELSVAGRRALAASRAAEAASVSTKEDEDEDTITLTKVKAIITRDNTKTEVEVFEHEVPILETIHKPENVEVFAKRAAEIADFEPFTEFERLKRFYGRNGEEAVMRIYGSPDGLARVTGTRSTSGKKRRGSEQSMQIDFSDPSAVNDGQLRVAREVVRKPSAKR